MVPSFYLLAVGAATVRERFFEACADRSLMVAAVGF
jgi:hypothetical protein